MNTEIENLTTRYLLGELSTEEMAAFEQRYFEEPGIVDLITLTETDLLDDYARGRMPADVRERFESRYMRDRGSRERVAFARDLTTRVDSENRARGVIPLRQSLVTSLRNSRLILRFAFAAAALVVVIGSLWLVINSRRHGSDEVVRTSAPAEQNSIRTAESPASRPNPAETETEPTPGQSPLPNPPPTPRPTHAPNRSEPPAPRRPVALALEVGAVRGGETGRTPVLIVPNGTETARLRLRLKDLEHPSYRMSLGTASGSVIAARTIKPVGPVANLFLDVPTARLGDGEYILTLTGVAEDGTADDLSKSLFRVKRKH